MDKPSKGWCRIREETWDLAGRGGQASFASDHDLPSQRPQGSQPGLFQLLLALSLLVFPHPGRPQACVSSFSASPPFSCSVPSSHVCLGKQSIKGHSVGTQTHLVTTGQARCYGRQNAHHPNRDRSGHQSRPNSTVSQASTSSRFHARRSPC